MMNQSSGWRRSRVLVCAAVAFVSMGAGKVFYDWSSQVTDEMVDRGRVLFEHEWTPNDPLAGKGDGLGPVFNAKSCVACHFQGGVGGGGPNQHNVTTFEVVPAGDRRHVASGVVHASATDADLLETRDTVRELFPIIPGGLRLVGGCTVRVEDFDPLAFGQINTPALFGTGLINGISDFTVQARGTARSLEVLSKELTGDFSTTPAGKSRGKFGWKGQFYTLEDFVAAACAVELGLSNPYRRQDLPQMHSEDRNAELDMDRRQFRELVAFIASLPAPREVLPEDPEARRVAVHGKELFAKVGCAECHVPVMDGVAGVYSDFLLYRIESPNDNPAYFRQETEFEMPANHPKPNEWKTPPLWGVADSAPYFHDGASPTLEQAIKRHGLQAKRSREAYDALATADQAAVVAFLKTLRAPELAPSPGVK